MIFAFVGIILIFLLFNTFSFFQTATKVLSIRFETANLNEGGMEGVLIDRFLGGLYSALKNSMNKPIFGYGLGMGTQAGSMLIKGQQGFYFGEGEWARLVGEIGPIMGLGVILIRVALGIEIAFFSFKKMVKGNILSWILLSSGLLILVQGQWGQPTSLGFSAIVGGLMIASLNFEEKPS
jgi:hypothetical protein